MPEVSDLVEEGKKFIFEELDLDEECLRLMGKLRWMRSDSKVSSLEYNADNGIINIFFSEELSVADFERVLRRYEIQERYIRNGLDLAKLSGPPKFDVYFKPIKF